MINYFSGSIRKSGSFSRASNDFHEHFLPNQSIQASSAVFMSPDSSMCADLLEGVDTVLDSLRKQPQPRQKAQSSSSKASVASALEPTSGQIDPVLSKARRWRSPARLNLNFGARASPSANRSPTATACLPAASTRSIEAPNSAAGAKGGSPAVGAEGWGWSESVTGRLAGFVGHRLLVREFKGSTPEAVRRWSVDRSAPRILDSSFGPTAFLIR